MGFKTKNTNKVEVVTPVFAELKRKVAGIKTVLPFKRFEGPDNLLVLADEEGKDAGYMEMLTILGKDLDFVFGVNSEGSTNIIRDFHTFLNTYTTDFDIVITQMAAETTTQQNAWLAVRDRVSAEMAVERDAKRYKQLQVRYQLAEKEIGRLKTVADKVKHQSYMAFIYGDSAQEARMYRDIFMGSGGRAITSKQISLDKKKTMLQILQDPSLQLNN